MIKQETFENFKLPKSTVFFDIETSGLSPYKDEITIITIAKYFNDSKCRITTLISERNEKEILYEFLNCIIGNYEIYTFNGYEFEEKFIYNKLSKYEIPFDFKQFKFISLKTILQHYSRFIGLTRLSRKDIEDFFEIKREHYYDIHLILKELKKDNLLYNEDLLIHSVEEIKSLIKLFICIFKMQFLNKTKINNTIFFLNDFSIFAETVKLSFKTNRIYPFNQFFLTNGEKIITFKNNIEIDIFTKIVYEEDTKIILYENENDYIPLFIKNDIIYDNIYFLLKNYKEYLIV